MANAGKLVEYVAEIPRHRRVKLEIVKRSDDVKGFKVPKRWIVERTFGWSIQSRRLIRDHEVKIEHSVRPFRPPTRHPAENNNQAAITFNGITRDTSRPQPSISSLSPNRWITEKALASGSWRMDLKVM